MKRLRLPRAAARQARRTPRVNFAATPYVLGRDDRGRTIYSSSPTLPRRA
jgi:hypothetical protein